MARVVILYLLALVSAVGAFMPAYSRVQLSESSQYLYYKVRAAQYVIHADGTYRLIADVSRKADPDAFVRKVANLLFKFKSFPF